MPNTCESVVLKQTSGSDFRRRILKGFGAQGFSQAVQVFIRLAEVPLLLSFWGTQLYGEWLMLTSLVAYISIGDGGFATAACREMTIRYSAGDKDGAQAVFQSTWVLLIMVSIFIAFLAFGILQVVSLRDWLGFSVINDNEIKVVSFLLIAHLLVNFQGWLINGGFWVTGRYPNGMYLIALTELMEFIGFASVVIFGGGPVLAASGYLAGRLLGTGLILFGQLRVSPWLRYGVSYVSLAELRNLSAPAFASLALPLGSVLNIQGIRLVVGLVLGPSILAIFTPMRTLSRLVIQPRTIMNRIIEPEMALAYGTKNMTHFRNLFIKYSQLALWTCIGVCLIVGPGAYWIFPAWTGGKATIHWLTYILMLSAALLNVIWSSALIVSFATNRLGRITGLYSLIYGAVTIFFGYLCIVGFGLTGVAFALLISEFIITVLITRVSLKMVGMDAIEWAKAIVLPIFKLFDMIGLGSVKKELVNADEKVITTINNPRERQKYM